MKRLLLGLTAVLSLAFAAIAIAAPSEYKVTGGGQTFASGDVGEDGKPTVKGPGDTITFQAFIPAQGASDDSTGRVNIIDRPDGGGKGEHFRGNVTCTFLMSDPAGGGYAELQGTGQFQDGTTSNFVVRIRDNGQGDAADPDQVEFDTAAASPNCEEDSADDEFEFTLARGNAKIHKQSPSQSGAAKQKSAGTSTRSTSLTSALR